jgi:hypothetical protein
LAFLYPFFILSLLVRPAFALNSRFTPGRMFFSHERAKLKESRANFPDLFDALPMITRRGDYSNLDLDLEKRFCQLFAGRRECC